MRKFLILLLFLSSAKTYAQKILFVDPFIGTGAVENSLSGNNFPGVTVPFGMIQLSPDTREAPDWDCASGYDYNDHTIYGFSHTHLSGTGASDLIDLLLLPVSEERKQSSFSHVNETASPGYYKVRLEDGGIDAELTATEHVGLHRYTYQTGSRMMLYVDLNHSADKGSWGRRIIKSQMRIADAYTLEGYRIITGWAPLRKVCFSIRFSQPIDSYTLWCDGRFHEGKGDDVINGTDLKGTFSFASPVSPVLEARVGLSAVSVENARENRERETGASPFEQIRKEAERAWEQTLSKLDASFPTETEREIFYTALYHAMLQPNQFSDVNGEYVRADYSVGKCPDGRRIYTTFSIWDTFRAAHALYNLTEPERSSDMVYSMIDHADAYGYLPIWELWGQDNYCMIGNHAVSIIVEAVRKNVPGIDEGRAWDAIYKTLTTPHINSPWEVWNRYGYMPENLQTQSVSITLEDAYDAWCAARLAERLGKTAEQNHFDKISENYKNLFCQESGLFQPKDDKGNWLPDFDPFRYGANGGAAYTEGNAWQWLWSVQHDIKGLIELCGGKEQFLKKLDYFFTSTATSGEKNDNASGFIGLYAHGNEPSHHVAFLYTLAGEPWKTDQLVHYIRDNLYTTAHYGYAGNDDCGEMSAWYVFSALGLYPLNPASGDYVLFAPAVQHATIRMPEQKEVSIQMKGNPSKDRYVKRIRWNGRVLSEPFIRHSDLLQGGTLEFEMTSRPGGKLLQI